MCLDNFKNLKIDFPCNCNIQYVLYLDIELSIGNLSNNLVKYNLKKYL